VCVREILTSQPTGSRESISHRIWDFVSGEESWGGEKCGLTRGRFLGAVRAGLS
jgi:hypothetical protein